MSSKEAPEASFIETLQVSDPSTLFKEVLAHFANDSTATEHARNVEADYQARVLERAATGTLTVLFEGQTMRWFISNVSGISFNNWPPRNDFATFIGDTVAPSARGGTFRLTISYSEARLVLFDHAGHANATYFGRGNTNNQIMGNYTGSWN